MTHNKEKVAVPALKPLDRIHHEGTVYMAFLRHFTFPGEGWALGVVALTGPFVGRAVPLPFTYDAIVEREVAEQ